MKVYRLEREVLVPKRLEEVFEFFSRPENLGRITPPWLRFTILSPRPIAMEKGALIDYTITLLGMHLRWRTLISAYAPPRMFVDEQLRGPYAYWKHVHSFAETEGGTRIRDEVEYAMPFGILGRAIRWLLVRRQLDAIFAYRSAIIQTQFQETAS